MPAYGKQKTEYFINRIREAMTVRPEAGNYEIRQILQESKKDPVTLDTQYIKRLMGKIERERGKRLDHQTLNKRITKIQDTIQAANKVLWSVALDPTTGKRDKTYALKTIIENELKLLESEMNAGVFERHIGTVKHKHGPDTEAIEEARKQVVLHALELWKLPEPRKQVNAKPNAKVNAKAKPKNKRST